MAGLGRTQKRRTLRFLTAFVEQSSAVSTPNDAELQ